jgi:hypothetical protein
VIRHATRNRTRRQLGVFLRSGLGLGGKVYASGRVLAVDDYVKSSSITHEYDYTVTAEDLGTVIAAPIAFGRQSYGVLFGAYRGVHGLGDRSIRLLEGVGSRCGEALFFAERVRAAAARAVRAERRRTASTLANQVDAAHAQLRPLRPTTARPCGRARRGRSHNASTRSCGASPSVKPTKRSRSRSG